MLPPKSLLIQVRVLENYGRLMTTSGSVTLTKDMVLLLRRTDAEPLIRQGVLEHVSC